jgi:hypothetical protein
MSAMREIALIRLPIPISINYDLYDVRALDIRRHVELSDLDRRHLRWFTTSF